MEELKTLVKEWREIYQEASNREEAGDYGGAESWWEAADDTAHSVAHELERLIGEGEI